MSLKYRISSPLEAGTSVLDAHQLPSLVSSALEYASRRLTRKDLHIKLAVVRHEYQASASPASGFASAAPSPAESSFSSPMASPVPSLISSASTPARSTFVMSPIQTFKQLVRSNTFASISSSDKASADAQLDLSRCKTVSPTFAPFRPDQGWPLSPLASVVVPMTPATPATPASIASVTTDTSYATSVSGGFDASTSTGFKLVHETSLEPRDEKALRQALDRARRKFRISPAQLSGPLPPSASGLSHEVMQRALAQGEVIFASSTMTVFSMDHLYSFKSALLVYSRTQLPSQLEDAVDELRRLILANSRKALLKSRLVNTYSWMGAVSDSALSDVSRMYRRAYGGPDGDAGIENDLDGDINVRRFGIAQIELPDMDDKCTTEVDESEEPQFRYKFEDEPAIAEEEPEVVKGATPKPEPKEDSESVPEAEKAERSDVAIKNELALLAELRRTTPILKPAPSPKFPLLKLQTSFDKPSSPKKEMRASPLRIVDEEQIEIKLEADDDEDGDLTARPSPGQRSAFPMFWGGAPGNGVSIDEVLSAVPSSAHPGFGDDDHGKAGPMTPQGYDDISPVTRGEWSFFMKDGEGWGGGKTAAIETC